MAKFQGAVVVNSERCKGCGLCVMSCPLNVLRMSSQVNAKGYNYAEMADTDDSKCIGCCTCGYVCPDACLSVYKVTL